MAKGNGTTRSVGPAHTTGGRTSAVRVYDKSASVSIELSEKEIERGLPEAIEEAKRQIASYYNGGSVVQFDGFGDYNNNDITDLIDVAKIKAKEEGVEVQILPRISGRNSPQYKAFFGELIGTRYEGKCPDLKIVKRSNGKTFVEYESFTRPYSSGNLSDMLTRGSLQSDSIIIDIRDTSIKSNHIIRQIKNKIYDPTFKRPIKHVWSYDGKKLNKEW